MTHLVYLKTTKKVNSQAIKYQISYCILKYLLNFNTSFLHVVVTDRVNLLDLSRRNLLSNDPVYITS